MIFRSVLKQDSVYWLLRVVLPLQLGICLYVAARPLSLQGWHWASLIGISELGLWAREAMSPATVAAPKWVLNNVPASLWLFSTTSAIALIWKGGRGTDVWWWLWAALAMGLGSELAQYLRYVEGTYDRMDAVFYLVAWWLALPGRKELT